LKEHKSNIEQFVLVPSSGGVFEVSMNNELVFSKKKENRKPDGDEVEKIIREKMEIDSPFGF
jgi:selenoprotein W-related protein